jgi:hypothetical protein
MQLETLKEEKEAPAYNSVSVANSAPFQSFY